MPGAALSVDFGTSHTVAVVRRADGRVEPLLFDATPLLPSAVFAAAEGLTVGREAVDAAHFRPACFEPHPKRRIDDVTVLLGDEEFTVVALFAAVLGRVWDEAVRVLGETPGTTVLTHPAQWGPTRLLVLRDAAEQAGLVSPVLVPEPVAAAHYYLTRLAHDVPTGSVVVVHDFGGGTFDAAVVRRTGAGFEVVTVDGLDDLGGVDVDAAIIAHLRHRIDRPGDWNALLSPTTGAQRRAWRNFHEDIRQTKETLSRRSGADLYVPTLDVDTHLTRDELDALTRPLLARAVRVMRAVIRSSGVTDSEIAGVFLVGGASRMPSVATTMHRELGHAPSITDQVEQVVAHGALLSADTANRATAPSAVPPVPVVSPEPAAVAPPPVSSPPVAVLSSPIGPEPQPVTLLPPSPPVTTPPPGAVAPPPIAAEPQPVTAFPVAPRPAGGESSRPPSEPDPAADPGPDGVPPRRALLIARVTMAVQVLFAFLVPFGGLPITVSVALMAAGFGLSWLLHRRAVRVAVLALQVVCFVNTAATGAYGLGRVVAMESTEWWFLLDLGAAATVPIVLAQLTRHRNPMLVAMAVPAGAMCCLNVFDTYDPIALYSGGAVMVAGALFGLRPWRSVLHGVPRWLRGRSVRVGVTAMAALIPIGTATYEVTQWLDHVGTVTEGMSDEMIAFIGDWPQVLTGCEPEEVAKSFEAHVCTVDEPEIQEVHFMRLETVALAARTAHLREDHEGTADTAHRSYAYHTSASLSYWDEDHPRCLAVLDARQVNTVPAMDLDVLTDYYLTYRAVP